MCPAFVFFVALWISTFNLDSMVLGEDSSEALPSPTLCLDCPVCHHPCNPPSPSSLLPGYPSYGAPPPPSPSFSGFPSYGPPPPPPSLSTYPSYRAPPSPPSPVQANCPPVPAQCCQYPSPPNPYQYQPFDNHSSTPCFPLFTFSIAVMLLLFTVFF